MKKTFFIDLFKSIKKKIVTFVSIAFFIALGTASFVGISSTGTALREDFRQTIIDGRIHSLDVTYTYGFTDDFLDTLAANPDVESLEAAYSVYETFNIGKNEFTAKIYQIPENINCFIKVEGNLPQKFNEIAIQSRWAQSHDYKIGDIIALNYDNEDKTPQVANIFNIIMNSGDDLNPLKDYIFNIPKMKYLKTNTFKITALVESPLYITKYTTSYGLNPTNSMPIETPMFLPESAFNKQSFMGYPSLYIRSNSFKQVDIFDDDFNNNSYSVRENYLDIFNDYEKSRENELCSNIQSSKTFIDQAKQTCNLEIINLQNKISDPNYSSFEIEEFITQKLLLESTLLLLDEINNDTIDVLIETICSDSPYIVSSNENSSLIAFNLITSTIDSLKFSFSALFVIIGFLVTIFTVSRSVREESILIGCKKALGFKKSEIFINLSLFSLISGIIGLILGALLSMFLVETTITGILSKTYFTTFNVITFSFIDFGIFAVIDICLVLIATFIAANKILQTSATKLLANEKNVRSKNRFFEKFKLWKKLPLINRTIVNNGLNDKSRVFSTTISILGCCSLIVCAFTMYNHIDESLKRQLDKVATFDTIIYADIKKENDNEISEYLDSKAISYAETMITYGQILCPDGTNTFGVIMVAKDEQISNFFHMLNGSKELELNNGIYISSNYCNEFNIQIGNEMSVRDLESNLHNFEIDGYFDFYLVNNYILMNKTTFETSFGGTYVTNAYIGNTHHLNQDKLLDDLVKFDSFNYIVDYIARSSSQYQAFTGIFDFIIIIYLILSLLMALIVILNLLIMFIVEKKNELIILIINGFTRKKAKQYIYLDTIFLSVIGIILGCILGSIMGNFSSSQFNCVTFQIMLGVNWPAIGIGSIITGLIILAISLIALRRINKFKLTDISKI